MLNGYTGEETELAIDASDQDFFQWSPDGQYLLTLLHDSKNPPYYCLNLYDVDMQLWLYKKPLSCNVLSATYAFDSTKIIYTSSHENNMVLELHNIEDETNRELYRTIEGNETSPEGISGIQWSSTGKYLTLVHSRQILGGTLNSFIVMNIETQDYFTLQVPSLYYAFYDSIWSADDR